MFNYSLHWSLYISFANDKENLVDIGSMVTILGVRGLDSSVNIMRFINKNMLVIENVDFSQMNEFMYKYMLPHKYYAAFKCISFFQISLNAVQLYKYYMQ